MAGHATIEFADVVVIGGGPGGAVTAAQVARGGLSVVLIARPSRPRHDAGESLSSMAGDVVRALGLEAEMDRKFPVHAGIKLFGPRPGDEILLPTGTRTWQARRADLDDILLAHARRCGVSIRAGVVTEVLRKSGRITGIGYRVGEKESGDKIYIRGKVVVDCSGQASLLSRHGVAGRRRPDVPGRRTSVFAQARCESASDECLTHIEIAEDKTWSWIIPVSEHEVSIGLGMPAEAYEQHRASDETLLDRGIAGMNAELGHRIAGYELCSPVRSVTSDAYCIEPFVGDNWLCVGDAHRASDRMFSFGLSFAMVEGLRAAEAIVHGIARNNLGDVFAAYAQFCRTGRDAMADVRRLLWKDPAGFADHVTGKHREEMVQFFAGGCFLPGQPALSAIRKALFASPPHTLPEGLARDIGQYILDHFGELGVVDAAYIEPSPDGLLLSFVIADDLAKLGVGADLDQLEDDIYSRYGREGIAILRWTRKIGLIPRFEGAKKIYDRRSAA